VRAGARTDALARQRQVVDDPSTVITSERKTGRSRTKRPAMIVRVDGRVTVFPAAA
jgi:hypothetical protein